MKTIPKIPVRTLLTLSDENIIVFELDGRIIDFNESFLKLLGYGKTELKKKKITDLIHKDDCDKTLNSIKRTRENNEQKRICNRCLDIDHYVIFVSWKFVSSGKIIFGKAELCDGKTSQDYQEAYHAISKMIFSEVNNKKVFPETIEKIKKFSNLNKITVFKKGCVVEQEKKWILCNRGDKNECSHYRLNRGRVKRGRIKMQRSGDEWFYFETH